MINRLIVLGEQSVVTIVACKRGFKCGWGCRSVARSVLFARRADASLGSPGANRLPFPANSRIRSHASRQPAPVFLSLPSVFSTVETYIDPSLSLTCPHRSVPLFQQPRLSDRKLRAETWKRCCYFFGIHLSLSLTLHGRKITRTRSLDSLLNL